MAGQTLLYVALGAGMMGVWSTTLFGCGGAIAWQRWEGTLELLVNAPSRYDFILVGQTFGAVVSGFYGILATLVWGVILFGMPIQATYPRAAALAPGGDRVPGVARHADRHHVRPVPARERAREPARVPDLAGHRTARAGRHAALLGAPDQLAAGADLGHGGDPGRDDRRRPPILAIVMCFVLAVAYYVAARVTLVFVLAKARRDATLSLQ